MNRHESRLPDTEGDTHDAGGACSALSDRARNQRWIDTAINRELNNIESCGDASIKKPDSPITLSMLKIASVVKGYGLEETTVYQRILYALRGHPASRKPRNIRYQWNRMLKRAKPRRRGQN